MAVPRSGTSWLQGMLANLPEIATVRETHLVDDYLRHLVNSWQAEQQQPHPDGLKAILSEAEFYDCIKSFSDRILQKILEFNPDAEIILEKTPGNLKFFSLLERLYPDAYFIHVLRDPRAVIASHLALKQEHWGWVKAERNHVDLARQWVEKMDLRDRAAIRLGDRFLEVRYEDLKQDRDAILLRVMKLLGLDYTREQLSQLIPRRSAAELDQTKADFPLQNPFFDTRPNFFRRGEIDSWKEELTQEQIIDIEAICIRSMVAYGYQPQYLKINL